MVQALAILVAFAVLGACDKPSKPSPPPIGSAAIAPRDAAVVAVVDANADVLPSDAAAIACTAAAIGTARKQADAHVKAGAFDAAIALLENHDCYLKEDQTEALNAQIAWGISDLSFAYYKAGKFGECYARSSGQLAPYMGNVGHFFDENHAVMNALEYNANLCQQAASKQRGPFEGAGPCTLVEGAFGVPASALDGTDQTACLVIEPGKRVDDANVCGDVVLVRQSKQGKLSKTKLTVGEGNLGDGGVCCNVSGVSFSRRGGKLAILVETLGRNCDGGTAASEEQHAYELTGTTLEVFHTLGAVAH